MKQFFILLLSLVNILYCHAQDSATGRKTGDTTRPSFAQLVKNVGDAEAARSIKKYAQGRAKLEQQAIIEKIKITSQQALILINRGFDTSDLKEKLDQSDTLLALARDGIFDNQGTIQTQRNLSVSAVILNELLLELNKEKKSLDQYVGKLQFFRDKIDSLNSLTVLYTFPQDSIEIMQYLKKIRVVSKVIGPVDTALDKSLKGVDEFQNRINETIFNLETHRETIEQYSIQLTGNLLNQEVAGLTGSIGFKRPFNEIIKFSFAKEKLALQYYAWENVVKILLILILLTGAGIFLKSLQTRALEDGKVDISNIDNLVLRYPFASGIIIILSLFQFIFREPPFIFSYLLWFIMLINMTVLFSTTLSKYWMRFWLVITLLFVLAGANNMVLQASRPERWYMLFLSLSGALYGSWILLSGHRHDLKERRILYFIAFMVGFEIIAALTNIFGRYNLSKTFLVSGYMGLVIAILFLWTVRLINQALGYTSTIYKHPEKKLFFINFNRLGNKAPNIFYVVLVLGWLILVGRNFYAFQRIVKSINFFLTEERTIGSYTFSVNSLVIFIVILFCSVLLSRIISFFADDPDAIHASERKKVGLGSWLLLVQIFVISMGLFLAFAASGIPLDRITIILGALGVGIGLGLQGLVNNLVSGLIIAFEKPVNVGDSIEVNGKSGTMKSIGFRSSVVALANGASLIIPNGDLLSQQLINWSTGRNIKRIDMVIRIAYGSDLEKVIKLVLQQLEKDERISKAPGPMVVPREFGQNSIDIDVMYWILQSSNSSLIKGLLIQNIEKAFKEEGIEIPIPRYNLHIENEK
jgi:potassium-dependent mechanosensitive channel